MRLFRWLLALALATFTVSAFLTHWSLLDGAPRNSLQMFLDGEAHRPFAYRLLAPTVVKSMEAALPDAARNLAANRIAPQLRALYVEPLLAIYEPQIPGINERAHRQWERERYRSSYVVMVALMLCALTGALLLMHHAAASLGASEWAATGAMTVYGLIVPTMFLNGGYFYDFTEQLGAVAFICCIYKRRWWLSGLVLLLMQLNKETAILMPLFMLPHVWQAQRWQGLRRVMAGLLMCTLLLVWVRMHCADLPGQPSEWHLQENLDFWLSLPNWQRTTDFYAIGMPLPRVMFLVFAVSALAMGWLRGATANVMGASMAFCVLAVLLFTMGYTDEFRNLSLALPLLVLLLVEPRHPQGAK
jgi:hypothetical protein